MVHLPSPIRGPLRAGLIATDDSAEFAAEPMGRCFVGPTFAIWCFAPDLQGSFVWGKLDQRSIADMMQAGQFIHRREISRRRRAISDCRNLERADADVLLGFIASARDHVSSWTFGLDRQALLVPAGLDGMMISGVLPMTGVEHSLRVMHDLGEALEFVDHPAAAEAHAAAERIVDTRRGPSVLLARLRAQIARELSTTTIERSAAALGMATRTLQRDLNRLDTSYSNELRRARILAAEQLLVRTDLKIEAIASQVGFRTASRMSSSLRRELNVTASELRAERRDRQLE